MNFNNKMIYLIATAIIIVIIVIIVLTTRENFSRTSRRQKNLNYILKTKQNLTKYKNPPSGSKKKEYNDNLAKIKGTSILNPINFNEKSDRELKKIVRKIKNCKIKHILPAVLSTGLGGINARVRINLCKTRALLTFDN
jgi:hypothetical protein